jgi:hypothetical protein
MSQEKSVNPACTKDIAVLQNGSDILIFGAKKSAPFT